MSKRYRLRRRRAAQESSGTPLRVNLGCGRDVIEGWKNVDIVPTPGVDVVADVSRSRPFDEDSVDAFHASHVLEHVPAILPFMENCWRMARPGALFMARVPYGSSDDADEDPTHVRRFFLGSFGYFGQPYYWRADYGYRGDWRVKGLTLRFGRNTFAEPIVAGPATPTQLWTVMHYRNIVTEMAVVLEAVKPAREPLRALQETVTTMVEYVREEGS